MLPKNLRISRKEFPRILTAGKRYNSKNLSLSLTSLSRENMANYSRFSFSVSKKVAKTAVARNKLRRQGYSVITRHKAKIKPGYVASFSFKKPKDKTVEKLTFQALEKEVLELLSSAGVLI